MHLILDPDGFAILEFKDFIERASWLSCKLPAGELWQTARCSTENPTIGWKLSDLTACQGFEL